MPGPCKPTELSRPLGVSASRGAGLPVRGSVMIDLLMIAPTRATSMNWSQLAARARAARRGQHGIPAAPPPAPSLARMSRAAS